VLRCVRGDGSVTWQKQKSRHAPFFALHDLTHFAVESVLGFQHGFFGLVAAGWEIEETTGKTLRGPLPAEAVEVECIVGVLDAERASGQIWSAEDLNRHLAIHAPSAGLRAPRSLTDGDLANIRTRRAELFAAWRGIETGQALELDFGDVQGIPAML
jgi:hypothetical protein